MICTEQEAAQKWCPQARVSDWTAVSRPTGVPSNACATNRKDSLAAPESRGEPHASTTCIGSRCMMWEWLDVGADGYRRATSGDRRGTCGLINGSAE